MHIVVIYAPSSYIFISYNIAYIIRINPFSYYSLRKYVQKAVIEDNTIEKK